MSGNIDLREAGRQIAESGLVDEVRKDRTTRDQDRGRPADDADDRDYGRKRRDRRDDDRQREDDDRPRNRRRDDDADDADDHDYGDGDTFGGDDDDDDDADTSTREDGEDGQDDDQDADDHEDGDEDEDDRRKPREQMHKVKVAGEVIEVSTSELIKGYSRERDYIKKTQGLAQRSRELNNAHTQVAQQYMQQMRDNAAIIDKIKQGLVGDIDGPEMRQLRQTNPEKWLLAREDYQARIQQVDAVFNHLQQQQERHRQDFAAQQAQTNRALVQQETERLLEYIPDWNEGRNGKPAGRERLARYLESVGFKADEYQAVIDHRMLTLADKARRYDALMKNRQKADEPQRKAKPVPKRFKPSKSSTASGRDAADRQDRSRFQQARDRLAKTGRMDDAGDAINLMLNRQARREQRRTR